MSEGENIEGEIDFNGDKSPNPGNDTAEVDVVELEKATESFRKQIQGAQSFTEFYEVLRDYQPIIEIIQYNIANCGIRRKLSQFTENKRDYANLDAMIENILKNYDNLFVGLDLNIPSLNTALKNKIIELLKKEILNKS